MIEENIIIGEQIKKPIRWQLFAVAGLLIIAVASLLLFYFFFSAPDRSAKPEQFVVTINMKTDQALAKLETAGFVRSPWALGVALRFYHWNGMIPSGSYDLSKAQSALVVARVLTRAPHEVWVVIPEGLRKEEIAGILATALGWTDAQKKEFITVDTNQNPDQFEGVYFPDTYLIPKDDSPQDASKKLYSHFQEKFAPSAADAIQQNIKWTTALKVASLIQREGKNADDMSVISSVIWNRLAKNMRLQIDATVQYARGDVGNGWWAPVSKADLQINSPYNTYLNAGLPPHPIANPGLTAITAALHPADTKCLYYIHDSDSVIHCAETYPEQQANIAKYLK